MPLAPLALFVFRRPEHTRRTIQALLRNPEIGQTKVFAFCDGPRREADAQFVNETRKVVRASGLPHLECVERENNVGLAANIIEGVSRLCAEFGRTIVLEDDLIVSSTFLGYLNTALNRYFEETSVYHVSAYMYPVKPGRGKDAVFLPLVNPWGWATWERAWRAFDPNATGFEKLDSDSQLRRRFDLDGAFYFFKMLKAQREGRVDSWFIRWYLSVFLRSGLGLFPARSLVQNAGLGEDATHTRATYFRQHKARAHDIVIRRYPEPAVDPSAYRRVKRLLHWDISFPVRAARKMSTIVRALVPRNH